MHWMSHIIRLLSREAKVGFGNTLGRFRFVMSKYEVIRIEDQVIQMKKITKKLNYEL